MKVKDRYFLVRCYTDDPDYLLTGYGTIKLSSRCIGEIKKAQKLLTAQTWMFSIVVRSADFYAFRDETIDEKQEAFITKKIEEEESMEISKTDFDYLNGFENNVLNNYSYLVIYRTGIEAYGYSKTYVSQRVDSVEFQIN